MMPASQRIIALAPIAWTGCAQAHSGHGLDGLLAHAGVHGTEIAALGLSLAAVVAIGRKIRQR